MRRRTLLSALGAAGTALCGGLAGCTSPPDDFGATAPTSVVPTDPSSTAPGGTGTGEPPRAEDGSTTPSDTASPTITGTPVVAGDATRLDVPGEVVENGVDGLVVVDHAAYAGNPGYEAFEPRGFFAALLIRNVGGVETNVLAYDYAVTPYTADGTDLSTETSAKGSLEGEDTTYALAPGATGTVFVFPTGPEGTVDGGTESIARYELVLGCPDDGSGGYCGN